MVKSRRICLALGAALLVLAANGASALAAPVTVNLRVEGSSKTLFEGPIATEAPAAPGITTESSEGPHLCDFSHNGTHEGFAAVGPTPTSALHDAATASGLAFNAKWSKSLNDFFITRVAADIEGGAPEFPSWGYAVNYTTAEVGGCQFLLASGSEVLWAYNFFNLPHLLKLIGPASASVGAPFTVHVADGQTGAPISGAAIGETVSGVTSPLSSSSSTDTSGNATVTLSHAGTLLLKASATKSVRSNGLSVCVHNGNDGTCGTTAATPTVSQSPAPPSHPFEGDLAKVLGLTEGHVYGRRSAPRVLAGTVEIRSGGTLRQVRISLERRYRGRCYAFSGSRARFVRLHRCATTSFFSVGATQSFSYLLPAPLPRGLYVFQMRALEDSGALTKVVEGASRVTFRVR
jgi:hypothetical protein